MMKLYKYLYYRLYSWNLKTWGKRDMPQFNALLGVSFMMLLNLGIIAGILDIIGFNIFFDETSEKAITIIIAFSVLAINYFWLVHKGKYKKIVKHYKNEPKNKKLGNLFLLYLYVIISFVILIFIAILSGKLKGLR